MSEWRRLGPVRDPVAPRLLDWLRGFTRGAVRRTWPDVLLALAERIADV